MNTRKRVLLFFVLCMATITLKAQTDSTGKPTCEQVCYEKYRLCVVNNCCPFSGCQYCEENCRALYGPCVAACGLPPQGFQYWTVTKTKVNNKGVSMMRLKGGNPLRGMWRVNDGGFVKGDSVLVRNAMGHYFTGKRDFRIR